jgi:hypothetical protein
MPLLVDTGILYALADADDSWHARAKKFFQSRQDGLIAPVTVIPEVCYLLHDRLGARVELKFVRAVERGEVVAVELTAAEWARLANVMEEYPELGFVDASVVALAERLRLKEIVTTDRRHFAVVRPKHVRKFHLLP